MVVIKNGTLINPLNGELKTADVRIENGKVAEIADSIPAQNAERVINASGLFAAPGLTDMHVHFREPGFEYKEDIITGALAAAAGGVTTACCMANTNPVADNAEIIAQIRERARNSAIRVLPIGAVTLGQNGEGLTDFEELKRAGVCALSDDGRPVMNAQIMLDALKEAERHGLLVICHSEDDNIAGGNSVNEGSISQKLGVAGRPYVAEDIMAARDVMLAAYSGVPVHIAHVSTAGTVEIIRSAKKKGVKVSCETCPQYFCFTEDTVLSKGTLAKMFPPLRTERDRRAVIEGLRDGTIDVIATDHAPHSTDEKNLSLTDAPGGIIGLETLLAACVTQLHFKEGFELWNLIRKMTYNPAALLGIDAGGFERGSPADFVIFDANEEWIVDPDRFKSKSRNTPFAGMTLKGRVKYTVCRGEIVYVD